MPNDTNDKGTSDLEREFEEEFKKEKKPEAKPAEFEKAYAEEMQEELTQKKELDPYAEKFYALTTKKFKTETELDNAVNKILDEIEHDYFFKELLQKTRKSGKLLLQKGLNTFTGVSAFQAANAITQLVRGNLKVTLSTLAKTALKGTTVGTTPSALRTLGFETEQESVAWQNFTNVCKESFDYLARNLSENADEPLEASKLSAEAFSVAVKKIEAERKSVAIQKTRRVVVAEPTSQKFVNRTVTLALALICIVLVAGIAGTLAVYAPRVSELEAQVVEKDETISSMNMSIIVLQSGLNQSTANINSLQTQITTMDAQITALDTQIATLFNYIYLNMTDYLAYNDGISQQPGANTTIFSDTLSYAGYVSVAVESTSNTTYVNFVYTTRGVEYNSTITVGKSGTAAFPVLPTYVLLTIGNTETGTDAVNATVTATYVY